MPGFSLIRLFFLGAGGRGGGGVQSLIVGAAGEKKSYAYGARARARGGGAQSPFCYFREKREKGDFVWLAVWPFGTILASLLREATNGRASEWPHATAFIFFSVISLTAGGLKPGVGSRTQLPSCLPACVNAFFFIFSFFLFLLH